MTAVWTRLCVLRDRIGAVRARLRAGHGDEHEEREQREDGRCESNGGTLLRVVLGSRERQGRSLHESEAEQRQDRGREYADPSQPTGHSDAEHDAGQRYDSGDGCESQIHAGLWKRRPSGAVEVGRRMLVDERMTLALRKGFAARNPKPPGRPEDTGAPP